MSRRLEESIVRVNPYTNWRKQVTQKAGGVRNEIALPCLVVAANEARCATLCEAGRVGGWMPISCSDVPTGVANYEKTLLRLVMVDLHNPEGPNPIGYRELLKWFAAKRDLLIVICGNEGDLEEEIWARQLGPWLYLTGSISASELSIHLREARLRVGPALFVEAAG
jgi:hypothetical protein